MMDGLMMYVHKLAYSFEKSVGSYIIKLSWVDESWDLYRFVIEGKSAEKKKVNHAEIMLTSMEVAQ